MSSFSYFSPQPNVYKPWVSVRLGNEAAHTITPHPVIALVDSGADVCFCSETIAAYLRALQVVEKRTKVISFTTANGSQFDAYQVIFSLYVCGREYPCPFYISNEIPPQTPIILGQQGFFDHHKVTFDLKNKEMNIIPYN